MGPNERLLYIAMILAKEQIAYGTVFSPWAKPNVLNNPVVGYRMPVLKFVRNTEIVAWSLTKK